MGGHGAPVAVDHLGAGGRQPEQPAVPGAGTRLAASIAPDGSPAPARARLPKGGTCPPRRGRARGRNAPSRLGPSGARGVRAWADLPPCRRERRVRLPAPAARSRRAGRTTTSTATSTTSSTTRSSTPSSTRGSIEEGGLDIHAAPVIGLCAESHCAFHAPLAFPETVDAALRVGAPRALERALRDRRSSPRAATRPAATGWFVHVFVDREARRAVEIPRRCARRSSASSSRGERAGDNGHIDTVSTDSRLVAGRFRLIRRLGAGAMASVFLAEDIELGRRVAIKRLHPDSGAEVAPRFRREMRVAASLSHPNVVKVFDAIEHEGAVLLVMEYVDGPSLAQRMGDGPLAARRGAGDPPPARRRRRPPARAGRHPPRRQARERDARPARTG